MTKYDIKQYENSLLAPILFHFLRHQFHFNIF